MKRVLFLPALLKQWHGRLQKIEINDDPEIDDVEEIDDVPEMPQETKEVLRRALGIYTRERLKDNVEPVTVRQLPKKQKLFTVLKGPHIDKKAREQFFFTTYGVELFMKTNSVSTLMLTETLARFYETGINELHIIARF